jgi:hypothetical protein
LTASEAPRYPPRAHLNRESRGRDLITSRITKTMMKRLFVLLFLACSVHASPMLRVISVKNARTLIVDNRGVAAEITLGQVVIAPAEEEAAAAYLRNTLTGAWVMVETDVRGESYVYRSPDALFINGELSRRAFLGSSVQMTYVGDVMPGPRRAEPVVKVVKAKPMPRPPRPHRRPRSR